MFRRWFTEAATAGLHEPNAMVVATADADGRPSSRMVLLKGLDERGFVFFTNTGSRKGEELAANPRCSLLFPWHPLERQVRVDGTATPLSRADVAAYFATRPRGSQLGAWASHQSRVVSGRAELDDAFAEAEARYPDDGPGPRRVGRVRRDPRARWSSGRAGRAGCTTGWSTAAAPDRAPGTSSVSPRDRPVTAAVNPLSRPRPPAYRGGTRERRWSEE